MINENTGSGNEKVGPKKSKKEKKYLKKVKQMFHFLQHAFRFSLEYTFILFHCQTIACWSLECSFCPDSGLQRKRDLKMNFHSNLYLRYLDMFARAHLGAFVSLILSAPLFVCI